MSRSSSTVWPSMLVSTLAPSVPALRNVSALPAEAIHIGGSGWIGRGSVAICTSTPSPLIAGTVSPRHSRRTVSMWRTITARRSAKSSGLKTKSLACQPEANDSPTRPPERLSTTAHSSATRIGSCNGSTTLPARIWMRSVIVASAAPVTAGLGYSPPNSWKCRSGVHTASKPCWSAKRAPSSSTRYALFASAASAAK